MSLRVTILGCGSSGGVPRVGGDWGACDPSNPKNRRRRCSLLLESGDVGDATTVLVDTSPDLREQLLDAKVRRLDAIVFTHAHADHTHGVDDLRPLVIAERARLDAWMDETTAVALKRRFGYVFETPPGSHYPPLLNERHLARDAPTTICGRAGHQITIRPYRLPHGDIEALGLRIGDFAYAPDLNAISSTSEPMFERLDMLLIDALRYRPHPSHFSLDETLAAIARFKPRRAVLTNMHTDLDYETLLKRLPRHVVPAFDGMQFTV
ncbi:MAG: MBL fold metallo-hydrolase [Hyphomicrobiales bacterium]|nr:MBL fold metallo-hydrolase [Hyphomicrobiales bacterium]MBV9519834.1 MBL fold metallo-hydrolase [Hyphomicrobiales bacterium]